MRLKELKCKNCGAAIKIDENISQTECEFCHTTFSVEDAYHDGYKFEKGRMKAQDEQLQKNMEYAKSIIGPFGKVFKIQYIITAVIAIAIFITAIIMIISFNINKNASIDEFDITRFNNNYELYKGTVYGSSVGRLIDEVITNNKKDKKHQITIKYKETETENPEEIKEIKKQLDEWTKYEVTFEYNEDGYIYFVTIEE